MYFGLLAILSICIFYFLNPKYRITFLTILSCCFIATYSYYLLLYVFGFSIINYYIGLRMPESKFRKSLFRTGIIFNILQLVVLKYASFTINPLLQILDVNLNLSRLSQIIIPVGISFFTLQGLGYLINIHMTWEKPEKNFIHFFLYIIFVPKFLSGPIERSNHFLPQLKTSQQFNTTNVIEGLRMALLGVFKKVAIANQLAPLISGAYAGIDSAEGRSLWLVFLVQALYLYFDFAGYTDIALGLAKTLGIDLVPNFNRPFLAENVSNFWKRFHMSLSSWFNDYIFRQTSFRYRRWGITSSVVAIFVTWTLFGIWHGAGWNFMLLGVLQALAIIYEFFTKRWRARIFAKFNEKFKVWFGRIMTYLFYCVSLVFFFSPDLPSVIRFFSKLFTEGGFVIERVKPEVFYLVFTFMIFFLILEIINNDLSRLYHRIEIFWNSQKIHFRVSRWIFYFFLITSIIILSSKVQNFIYFQF